MRTIRIFLLLVTGLLVCPPLSFSQTTPEIDTAHLHSKVWRDSVASYAGRVATYHQELFDHDVAMSFSLFPIVGESYVNRETVGIMFFGSRLVAGTATGVGIVRLLKGSPNTGLNIGLAAGGVVAYLLLKWWEISDIAHQVSYLNEEMVDKYEIATPDIEAGSIRFPTREWPERVTHIPHPRSERRAREEVDNPLPTLDQLQPTRLEFQFPF